MILCKNHCQTTLKKIKKEGAKLQRTELAALNRGGISINDNPFKLLGSHLDTWMRQLPLVGFNTGKYDVNAMKKYLFKILQQDCNNFVMPSSETNSKNT